MGQGFVAETAQIGAASQKVHSTNQDIQTTLSTLYNALAPLPGQWKGEASTSFQQLLARYQDAAQRLNTALEGIGDTLAQTQRNYDSTEEANTSGLAAMGNAFPV
ncbi:MAG: WXG100 family type VII secretion target [Actinomycetota bacterium]|nr:WXG100 family type VII secretion target [Actinomycetota bacterium]